MGWVGVRSAVVSYKMKIPLARPFRMASSGQGRRWKALQPSRLRDDGAPPGLASRFHAAAPPPRAKALLALAKLSHSSSTSGPASQLGYKRDVRLPIHPGLRDLVVRWVGAQAGVAA